MATQRTHREFAPRYAVGKVPVPWGRECHWETRRSWLWKRQRSTCWVVVLGLWSFAAAKSCHERSPERQLNGAHSLHALHLQLVWKCGRFGQSNIDGTDCLGVLLCNRLNDFKLAWNGVTWMHFLLNSKHWGQVKLLRVIGFVNILCGKISHLVVWQFGGQGKHGHAADTQGVRSQICCGESPRALGQRVPLGDQKILTLEATAKHMLSCGSWALVLCSSKVMPWAFARTPTERGSLSPCPPFAVGLKMREVWTIQHWRNGLLGCITLQSAQRFQACLERYGHECTSFWIQNIEVKSSYWESSDLSIFCAGRSLIL